MQQISEIDNWIELYGLNFSSEQLQKFYRKESLNVSKSDYKSAASQFIVPCPNVFHIKEQRFKIEIYGSNNVRVALNVCEICSFIKREECRLELSEDRTLR
jgi:hypothetical protein